MIREFTDLIQEMETVRRVQNCQKPREKKNMKRKHCTQPAQTKIIGDKADAHFNLLKKKNGGGWGGGG